MQPDAIPKPTDPVEHDEQELDPAVEYSPSAQSMQLVLSDVNDDFLLAAHWLHPTELITPVLFVKNRI